MAIECDVLVVGAGPAGSAAARAAAMGGAKTIFIDKKKEVGTPVQCAEGIGKYLFPYLPFKIPKNLLKWRIDGMRFWVEGITIDRLGELWEGYSINRKYFDKWLSQKAILEGASLRTNTELVDLEFDEIGNVKKVIIMTENVRKEINPRILIAADGVNSTTLQLLGEYKPKKGDIAEVYSWEMKNLGIKDPHMEQIFLGDFTPGGYAYIFPKSRTTANVGIGGIMREKDLEKYFREFMEIEIVKKQVKNAEYTVQKTKEAVWGDLTDKVVIGNVILSGDAANHNLKPFVEGILPSIISGDLAGKLATKAYAESKFELEGYFEAIEKRIHPHFKCSRKYAHMIKDWFLRGRKEKSLLFAGLAMGLFEIEKLDELEEITYEEIESLLISQKTS